MAKLVAVIHFLAFLVTLTIIGQCFGNRDSASKVVCIEAEKQVLVSFEQELIDPYDALFSWRSTEEEECCEWEGIVCDNMTGHVTELNLGGALLSGKISPSLLKLKHLTRLDLSDNNFVGIEIPSFLGSLVSLRYLNLMNTGFEGMIPQQLGNLSDLKHLEIAGTFSTSNFYSKSLLWLSGLSSLEYLDMSYANLSETSDHWLFAINKLPSLLELHLSSCELRSSSIPLPSRLNLTSLLVLDVRANNLGGLFLGGFLRNMSHLRYLDLSFNGFGPNIPNSVHSLSTLQYLNLGYNDLQGFIPSNIANLTSIVTLDLSNNSLHGKIPLSVGNLCNLEELDLSDNKLNGNLSEAFQSFLSGCLSNKLNSLSLDGNSFSGHISGQVAEFKNLSWLSLARNNISGPIPVSLGSLTTLKFLDISSNLLKGVVSEPNFTNLTNLKTLFASGNSLTLRVGPEWIPPFNLVKLNMGSWNVGPLFPLWLKSQSEISNIGLSNTRISGIIPNWFWNLPELNYLLDLSRNQLRGHIPEQLQFLSMLDLSSNAFTGPLPRVSSHLDWLDLSNNSFSGDISRLLCNPIGNIGHLNLLKLGDNLLEGNIPDCWGNWPFLRVIGLRNNNLSGEIPISIGLLKGLKSLHIRNNSLTGEIPNSLHNCSSLVGLDLGLNKLGGHIPSWMGNLSFLGVLNLHSNALKGQIPLKLCSLTQLQILDVADNNLSGSIPRCFKNFKAMSDTNSREDRLTYSGTYFDQYAHESTIVSTKGREYQYEKILHLMRSLDLSSNNFSGEIPEELASLRALKTLNLSGNHLHGRIPRMIGDISELESLDLSMNRLSGNIPVSMSGLRFLNYLNLSYNNLSGEIPKSTQLQSLGPSSFIGNQFLCGDPLPKRCREGDDNAEPSVRTGKNQQEEEDDLGEDWWFRLGIGMGFGVGLLGIIVPLVFLDFWRRAYFWFFQEYVWYKIEDWFIKIKYSIFGN